MTGNIESSDPFSYATSKDSAMHSTTESCNDSMKCLLPFKKRSRLWYGWTEFLRSTP